ncbi:hypothetical protein I5Q34_34205 [Streptomyces sp. AV19]|uniref:hypothetical protein n=1 Tax=Streptomyces sp. AV19 TaxID=2793068 RepID=UPI0018FE4789|nr:hypothetical protein [Streptomyces sp. AV19]MBH1939254.1 hypothetical protein [Streptomyces sp. AV19]MDG4531645.1 hypothetical protein [Streptomyces sp. AV19]
MTGPTREQLLAALDQAAAHGRLTEPETVLLRVGIEHLAADLAALRRQVGGLQTALHTTRHERDDARAELNRLNAALNTTGD